jgi:hypothetical protein
MKYKKIILFLKSFFNLLLSKNIISYGLFLGSFLSIFECMMRLLANYRKQLNKLYRCLICGFIGGISIFFLPSDVRVSITMFFLVRALEILGLYGVELKLLPSIPHCDTLIMSLSSAQVAWSWLFKRNSLDYSYLHFLDTQGGQPKIVQYSYAELNTTAGIQPKTLIELNEWRNKNGYPNLDLNNFLHRCQCLHPHTGSCTLAFLQFWQRAFIRALPVNE